MLIGPLCALALVVVAAGVAKGRHPGATGLALEALGLRPRRSPAAARALGAVEVAVGLAVLVTGQALAAAALAVAHLGFAAVTAVLLRHPDVPCGCFGSGDAPATRAGLGANLVAAAVATMAVVRPPGPPVDALASAGPLGAVTLVALVATGAWLVAAAHDLGRPGPTAARAGAGMGVGR